MCLHCACPLPLDEFRAQGKPNGKGQGRAGVCKFCQTLAARQWQLRNPERYRELLRNWYARHSVGRKKQRSKAERDALPKPKPRPPAMSPEEKRRRQAEGQRRRHEANPHVRAEKRRRRKAAERGAAPEWTDREETRRWYHVAQVLSRGGVQFHVDHIVPLRGGTVCGLHVPANLTVLPWHVNTSKGHRYWPDMP